MKKSRFTESQIVAILKEGEAGMSAGDLSRKHGISRATYFNWRSKYGGVTVNELKRMKELEAENSKLKRMYADLALKESATRRPNWYACGVTIMLEATREPSALIERMFLRNYGHQLRIPFVVAPKQFAHLSTALELALGLFTAWLIGLALIRPISPRTLNPYSWPDWVVPAVFVVIYIGVDRYIARLILRLGNFDDPKILDTYNSPAERRKWWISLGLVPVLIVVISVALSSFRRALV